MLWVEWPCQKCAPIHGKNVGSNVAVGSARPRAAHSFAAWQHPRRGWAATPYLRSPYVQNPGLAGEDGVLWGLWSGNYAGNGRLELGTQAEVEAVAVRAVVAEGEFAKVAEVE